MSADVNEDIQPVEMTEAEDQAGAAERTRIFGEVLTHLAAQRKPCTNDKGKWAYQADGAMSPVGVVLGNQYNSFMERIPPSSHVLAGILRDISPHCVRLVLDLERLHRADPERWRHRAARLYSNYRIRPEGLDGLGALLTAGPIEPRPERQA